MLNELRVTLVQSDIVWTDVAANIRHFDEKLARLSGKTDLVILPEMFTTGFTMEAAGIAEQMNGSTKAWMSDWAEKLGAVITGSIIIQKGEQFYNRLLWIFPDGRYHFYDKRHLFAFSGEDKVFSAGKNRLIVEWKGWYIAPMICYDLRFPVWTRNVAPYYDLLLYVANFPEKRSHAWNSLLIARAIENQVYTIGVNRVGTDGKGNTYSGDSCLVDYAGNLRYRVKHQEDVATLKINKAEQANFRAHFNFLPDGDAFEFVS